MKPTLRAVGGWCGLAGAGLLVFAARSREIHLYAGDIPFLDQWKIEGAEILQPWLQGTLSVADFFRPHHEHLPVWTRLLAWLEAVVTGQWDPRVQMAVNALLQATFVMTVARWLWSALGFGAGTLASALLLTFAILPIAWENITWGFQSQFPLGLLCLFLHVHGALTHPPMSARWWAAQAAGFAGLFTLAGMATAPLAVVLALLWTGANRRSWLVPLGVAAAGIALLLLLGSRDGAGPISGLHVQSLTRFLHAWFVQLGWPAGTVLLNLPGFAFALQLRGRRDATAFDRIILALGIWAVLQAAALGYARGGGYVGYVSRYSDLLMVGTLANFLALLRVVWPENLSRLMPKVAIIAWLAVVGSGLHTLSTTAHTYYFHQHAAANNLAREVALRAYVRDGDLTALATAEGRELVYPVPEDVARLLAQPDFRALLPVLTGAGNIGMAVRGLQAYWLLPALLGGLGIAVSLATRRHQISSLSFLPLPPDPWRWRLAGCVGALALGGIFLWPHPFTFGEYRRKIRLLGASGTISPPAYAFTTRSAYPPGRAVGAAVLSPIGVRNAFHGTHMSGSEDVAALRSESFVLVTPYLIVPFAGHPQEPGIALQVMVEDEQGRPLHTYTGAVEAPEDVGFWEIDTQAHQGRPARIALVDQSAKRDGWIAAASPQYAWKPGQGQARTQAWAYEQTAGAHTALGEIGATLTVGWLLALRGRRKPAEKIPVRQ